MEQPGTGGDTLRDPPREVGPTGTLLGPRPAEPGPEDTAYVEAVAATLAHGAQDPSSSPGPLSGAATTAPTTILPWLTPDGAVPAPQPRFSFRQRLGAGAAGDVDLVLDNDIQRPVAIKYLRPTAEQGEMLLRFADEVRTVGHLEHPNIVPIHDVGRSEDGRYYFVMKYVQGETLQSVIAKLAAGDPACHRTYSFAARARIFGELLRAIEFAHDRGVIHRDIKPANIMVGPFGEVMMMDWGIAKLAGRAKAQAGVDAPQRLIDTGHRGVLGTPLYMAPEQAHGASDQRSDIYSLCAVLYELLTLRSYLRPKRMITEILAAIADEAPRHPLLVRSPHQSRVPADLAHFVMKGLAKDPAQRYQSVAEMRARLQRINEGYTPVQCPFTLHKRLVSALVHQLDRRPVISLMLALASLAGLFAATYMLAAR